MKEKIEVVLGWHEGITCESPPPKRYLVHPLTGICIECARAPTRREKFIAKLFGFKFEKWYDQPHYKELVKRSD